MTMTDPLADMLTRIRNGQQAKLYTISSPYSKLRENVLEVLKNEGYIRGYSKIDAKKSETGHAELKIELKYLEGEAVIKIIKRVSKPGRRNYSKITDLKKFYNGLGLYILSTPKGVMSDHDAAKENVGGEVLCCVF